MYLTAMGLYVALLMWLDWVMHRQPVVIMLLLAASATIFLTRTRFAPKVQVYGVQISPLSGAAVALVTMLLAPLYFLVRGAGTYEGAGGLIMLMLATGAVLSLCAPLLDRLLAPLYVLRDRTMNRYSVIAVSVALPVGISFVVVHGNLLDLPALVGGQTRAPKPPTDMGGRLPTAVILSAVVAFLLLRDKPSGR